MMARQFLGLVAFATIAILMQISSSTACMCMPKHSQSSYCDSDYGKCDGKLMYNNIQFKHEYHAYKYTECIK